MTSTWNPDNTAAPAGPPLGPTDRSSGPVDPSPGPIGFVPVGPGALGLDPGPTGPQPDQPAVPAGDEAAGAGRAVPAGAVPVEPEGPVRAGRLWPAEVGLAAVAAVLFGWSLSRNGWANTYYSAAARSMSMSWKNFLFGAFDPGGWITVDKPPLAQWLQALAVRAFGMSSWSILLPSVLCGALAVYLLTVTVRRVWGPFAGFCAGAALALTPTVLAVSRSNNPDAALMLCAVAAAWATERAISQKKLGWMLAAGAFCGLGFLTKLLAIGTVMPGLWLAYLLAARVSWPKRIVHLLAAGGVFLAISAGWVAMVDLTPAQDRPYIGSSTDGTALDLVLGYNGLGRLTGNERGSGAGGGPGGAAPGGAAGGGAGAGRFGGATAGGPPAGANFGGGRPGGAFGGGAGGTLAVDEFGGTADLGRLFNNGMGDQVMWLSPLAAAAFIGGLVAAVRRKRLDAQLASVVGFGAWAALTYVMYAYAQGIFHNYYVSFLAPALAALAGIGASMVRRSNAVGRIGAALAVLITAGLQWHLISRVGQFGWLRPLVALGLVAVAGALVASAFWSRLTGKVLVGIAGGGMMIALLSPAVWAWSGTQHAQSGTFPDARPGGSAGGVGGPGLAAAAGQPGVGTGAAIPPNGSTAPTGGDGGVVPTGPYGSMTGQTGVGSTAGPTGADARGAGGFGGGSLSAAEISWLESQRGTEKWIIAVSSSMQAGSAIIEGHSVMAMGGFSGSDPAMTTERLATLVEQGDLRFVAAGGAGGPGGGFGGGGSGAITSIIGSVCTPVDASSWGETATSTVYDCAGQAAAIRQAGATASTATQGGSGTPAVSPGATPTGSAPNPIGGAPGTNGAPGATGATGAATGPGGAGSAPAGAGSQSGTGAAGRPGGPGGAGGVDVASIDACLTKAGIATPSSGAGADFDPTSAKVQNALAACGLSLPGVGSGAVPGTPAGAPPATVAGRSA